jgi:hypothetical protein
LLTLTSSIVHGIALMTFHFRLTQHLVQDRQHVVDRLAALGRERRLQALHVLIADGVETSIS